MVIDVDNPGRAGIVVDNGSEVNGSEVTLPFLSPDRRTVAYLTDSDGRTQVWVVGSDGSNPRPLLEDARSCSNPDRGAWFPQSSEDAAPRVLLDCDQGLLALRPSEGEPEQPTGAGTTAGSVAPDGRRLAFVRIEEDDRTGGSIRVLDLPTGDVEQVTPGEQFLDNGPVWSPDGERLAFRRSERGERGGEDLWTVTMDDRLQETPIADDGNVREYAPTWSPDGNRLAFTYLAVDPSEGDPAGARVAIADADGAAPTQQPEILEAVNSQSLPDWSRR